MMNNNIQNQLYYLESKIKDVESRIYQINQACSTGQYNPYDPNVQQMLNNYTIELNNLKQQYDNTYMNYVNYTRQQQNYSSYNSNYNSQYNSGYNNNSNFEPYSYNYQQSVPQSNYSNSTPGNRFEDPEYQRKTLGTVPPMGPQDNYTPMSNMKSNPVTRTDKLLKEELTLLSSDFNYKILPFVKFTKNDYTEEEVKAIIHLVRKHLKDRGKEFSLKTLMETKELLVKERENIGDTTLFHTYKSAIDVIKRILGHIQLLLNKLFSTVCGMEKNVIKQLTVQNLDYLLNHKEQLKFPNLGEILIRIDNDLRKTFLQENNVKLERCYTDVITFDREVTHDFNYNALDIHMELRDEVITVGSKDTPKTHQVLHHLLMKTPGFTYMDVRTPYGELFFYVVAKGEEILLIRK